MAGNGNGQAQAAQQTDGADGGRAIAALRRDGATRTSDPATAMVGAMMPQMARALPRHLDRGRFERLVLTQLRTVPKLMNCEPASLMAALMSVAQLGLEPDKAMGHVYLVPYGKEVQVIVGYKGLMELARRSGAVKSIMARVAYAADAFEVRLGTDEAIEHTPSLSDRGEAVAVYAIATLDNGERVFDFMSVGDVERVRKRAKAGSSGPWQTDWEEMARKTVVRRLCKYLPLSPEMAAALDTDEQTSHYDRRAGETVMAHADRVVDAQVVESATDVAHDPVTGEVRDAAPPQAGAPGPTVEAEATAVARGTRLKIAQKNRLHAMLADLPVGAVSQLPDDELRTEIPRLAAERAAAGLSLDDFRELVLAAQEG